MKCQGIKIAWENICSWGKLCQMQDVKNKITLHHILVRYLHKTKYTVFNILSPVIRIKFYSISSINNEVTLIINGIYSPNTLAAAWVK